jgi:SAM-dependent methyltransferase
MSTSAGPDWGLGNYERTATALLPAADALVFAAQLKQGERVLDLGCGTGNVALQAARLRLPTVAVDPASRLREVTSANARREGLDLDVRAGTAGAIPLADGSVDVVLSNFGVIFDPDPVGAVAEVARVLAPGGRALLTAWLPGDTISQMVGACMGMVAAAAKTPPGRGPFSWHDQEAVAELFQPHSLAVTTQPYTLVLRGDSPNAYLESELTNHPLALRGFALLDSQGEAQQARERLLAILEAGNEDPDAFRATSRYVIVTAS